MDLILTALTVYTVLTLGYCQGHLFSQAALTKNTSTSRVSVCVCFDDCFTTDKWVDMFAQCRQMTENIKQKTTTENVLETTTSAGETTTSTQTPPTAGPVYRGCYDDDASRVLPYDNIRDTTAMTIDMCQIHCTQKGFSFFGLEAGEECFCGDEIKSGYVTVPENQCGTTCSGDPAKTCGGSWAIAIYQTTTENVLETTTSAGETTTSPQTPPTAGPIYRGCYDDDASRVLPHDNIRDTTAMTIDMCQIHCTQKGFSFFGLEAGEECFCGDEIKSGYVTVPENQCGTTCSGDPAKTCGGSWAIAIYQTTTENVLETTTSAGETTTSPETPPTAGPLHRGCYDDDGSRVLPYDDIKSTTAMTIDMCQIHCTQKGFSFFGLEDGQECFCGNEIKSGYVTLPEYRCGTTCSGNPAKKCGGWWAIDIYQVV